jgi:hypothetical protein
MTISDKVEKKGSSGKFVLFLEDEAMHLMNGRGIIA